MKAIGKGSSGKGFTLLMGDGDYGNETRCFLTEDDITWQMAGTIPKNATLEGLVQSLRNIADAVERQGRQTGQFGVVKVDINPDILKGR